MSKISLDPETEKNLVRAFNRGPLEQQKQAFAKVYEHYHPHLLRYFKNKIGREEVAEDLTSTVFTKALAAKDSFRWEGVSLSAWLYRIAHNILVDYFRQTNLRQTQDIEHAYSLSDAKAGPEEEFSQWEMEEKIKDIVQELPPRERNIIYLKFFEGYTNRSIAKITGLSETNIGTIVYRVVRQMRESFPTQ